MQYAETAYRVKLDIEQATKIRDRFFEVYSALKKWHLEADKKAGEGCSLLTTILGRKRWLPQGADARWPRFTALLNAPVQGGAADVIKAAILELEEKLPEGAGLVSTVHDELIVEVSLKDAETVKKLVEDVMIKSAVSLYPSVKFEVEGMVCESWAEKA